MQAAITRGSLALVGLLLAAPTVAQTETQPPILRQTFKLNPEDGCFRYTGKAFEFTGRFRAGAYVSVTATTLNEAGQPAPAGDEQRIPIMDAPEYRTADPASWFGPLPASRMYSIGFMPSFTHGSPGQVVICGRVSAPEQQAQSLSTPQERQRLNKMADDMMANDPYSRALLEEPKVLPNRDND
ncbi:hypothetical protein DXT98_01395 [Agrobacterium sp. ICMP 7243]|nr:hypothetical protein DXT98_01395 [Agrobacterium sp. ICMP 7243]